MYKLEEIYDSGHLALFRFDLQMGIHEYYIFNKQILPWLIGLRIRVDVVMGSSTVRVSFDLKPDLAKLTFDQMKANQIWFGPYGIS